jgi:hypothetical protein
MQVKMAVIIPYRFKDAAFVLCAIYGISAATRLNDFFTKNLNGDYLLNNILYNEAGNAQDNVMVLWIFAQSNNSPRDKRLRFDLLVSSL